MEAGTLFLSHKSRNAHTALPGCPQVTLARAFVSLNPLNLTQSCQLQVVNSPAENFYKNPKRSLERLGRNRFDVVSITPPYEEIVYSDLLTLVAESEDLIGDGSFVVGKIPPNPLEKRKKALDRAAAQMVSIIVPLYTPLKKLVCIILVNIFECVGPCPAVEYPVELGNLPPNIGRMTGMKNRKYGRTMLAVYCVRPVCHPNPSLNRFL